MPHTQDPNDLITLPKAHETFVGVDSDGCVFDTMEIKQKQCFHPEIIACWGLEPIEPILRRSAEFVNLYSRYRGRNRFLSLIDCIDLIRDRPEVAASGATLPEFTELRKFIASGVPLGNPAFEAEVARTGNAELAKILQWSRNVNQRIEAQVKQIPPFKWVVESLEQMQQHSDIIVVSQTPCEALEREWSENSLDPYLAMIAGQEHGTKSEHLRLATHGKYAADRVLMIGDAPGDYMAALDNGAAFYPINPSKEEVSWERFHREAYDRFLDGTYAGAYEDGLIAEFNALLPEHPDW